MMNRNLNLKKLLKRKRENMALAEAVEAEVEEIEVETEVAKEAVIEVLEEVEEVSIEMKRDPIKISKVKRSLEVIRKITNLKRLRKRNLRNQLFCIQKPNLINLQIGEDSPSENVSYLILNIYSH